jgi:hypothetical protein
MKTQKKYIIVISVVVVLWCAFMGYRHYKMKHDTDAHRQKGYNQITEVAKKSPRAGLAQMGSALKKYYEKNQAYPSKLIDLYPQYLANKSFIEEIDWYYEPRGNDFFLSKTVIVGNKRMVASIDKELRPWSEKGVMVATPSPVPKTFVTKAKEVKKLEDLDIEESEESARARLALAREMFLKTLRQREIAVTSVSLPERDEARIISTVQPEIISISEPDIGSDMEFELSNRYLVWKDNNGVLGFSNIKYPEADRLSICAVGRWYNVKIPLPKGQEPVDTETETAKRERNPEMTATNLDRYYLVWRDKHGTLGFGNVQYPERDPVSVFETDNWVSMERPHLAKETGTGEDQGLKKGKSHHTIASELSPQYLVWRDKHGTLGFGNVQYPELGRTSYIHVNGSWERVAN